MTAPAYNNAPMPQTGLGHLLDYQCAVNRALLASTRPLDRAANRPLLSDAEIDEMDVAYRAGFSAAEFAARLIARDKSYDEVLANNARLLALNIQLESDLRGVRNQGVADAREITRLTQANEALNEQLRALNDVAAVVARVGQHGDSR